MKKKAKNADQLFCELLERYPSLITCKDEIYGAYTMMKQAYEAGNKLLIAGNGGSASDSEHIVGELMKSFLFNRKIAKRDEAEFETLFGQEGKALAQNLEGCLPAIPLTSMPALSTAFLNDVDPLLVFAQLLYGYGGKGDVFLGISTSGNSKNIINAMMAAKIKGMRIIGLTGQKGGKFNDYCDIIIHVPEEETFKIQELHLPVYHVLCAMLEADFFEEK